MTDIDLFVTAIHAITHYSEKRIKQTIEMTELGIDPMPSMHGTPQWDIWMHYRVLREYERRRIHEPRKSG